uniref:Replication protein n=1 Tax=uncultured prokaryote TaxID=198431 RepID=A0A0H5Q640_9ZZZZ|nr:hypothetical protein [uncultured prokaryote]
MATSSNVLGGRSDLTTRIFPNGECVVFRNTIKKARPFTKAVRKFNYVWLFACWDMFQRDPELFRAVSLFMGLSLVRNFDNLLKPSSDKLAPTEKKARRYGRNGITRSGARTVRQGAYLMQKRFGIGRITFATVTLPDLPIETMGVVHDQWHKIVERYRLLIRRALKEDGLSGDMISVSEIQEKRYKKTGVPVLHLHSIWVGRLSYGQWSISTKAHDDIWRKAVGVAIKTVSVSFKSAANLQEVKSSAAGYLGKYMSKGAAVVSSLVDNGFDGWLPRQWWNMSRDLVRWVKAETLTTDEFGDFLRDAANGDSKDVWDFFGHVQIDIGEKQQYWLATYGRLNPVVAQELRDYINLTRQVQHVTLSS